MSFNTVVCNVIGGPGVGKTTAALALTALLKKKGVLAEYVPEAVKHSLYRGTIEFDTKNQDTLMVAQFNAIDILVGQVQVVVTDSPMIIQLAYHTPENSSFALETRTIELMHKHDNFNILLERNHAYDTRHRFQNEPQAIAKHNKIVQILDACDIPYTKMKTSQEIEHEIFWLLTDHYCI